MEFNQVIQNRRSIRSYDKNKKVTKEQIEEIIKAGLLAPSWKNSETARYYAVVSEDKISEVSEKCLPEFNQRNSSGAALIVTAFVKSRSGFTKEGKPENEGGEGWGFYDLGLANENLVLKAAEMGLGSLIMGIRDGKALRESLNIPEEQEIVSVIAVGYSDAKPEMPNRKNLEDVAKFF